MKSRDATDVSNRGSRWCEESVTRQVFVRIEADVCVKRA